MNFITYIIVSFFCVFFTTGLGVAIELKNKQKQKDLIINAVIFIAGFIVGVLTVI